MKKRLTSILLTLALVASLLPAMETPARAENVVYVNSASDFRAYADTDQSFIYNLQSGITYVTKRRHRMDNLMLRAAARRNRRTAYRLKR